MGEGSSEDELTQQKRQLLAESMRFYSDMRFKQLTVL
jgi:hypothetical protein